MLNKIFSLICVSIFVLGCAQEIKKSDRPDWTDNPGSNVVGKCSTHVMGAIAQEQCAYKKGLSYIAMSKGVSVDINSTMTMQQTGTERSGSSHGQVSSVVKMDEKDIKVSATIIDKWHDKVADICMY